MLKRSLRLQKKDIDRIYKKGRSFPRDFLIVRYVPNRAGHSRFCVIISKKVIALANDRNQAKRKVYQVIGDNQELWQKKEFDLAFTFKKYGEPQAAAIESLIKTILAEIQ